MSGDGMFLCADCGVDTAKNGEYYHVHDELWQSVADDGMLCIGCLEARLGRLLTADDFSDAPINWLFVETKSPRIQARLEGLRP